MGGWYSKLPIKYSWIRCTVSHSGSIEIKTRRICSPTFFSASSDLTKSYSFLCLLSWNIVSANTVYQHDTPPCCTNNGAWHLKKMKLQTCTLILSQRKAHMLTRRIPIIMSGHHRLLPRWNRHFDGNEISKRNNQYPSLFTNRAWCDPVGEHMSDIAHNSPQQKNWRQHGNEYSHSLMRVAH